VATPIGILLFWALYILTFPVHRSALLLQRYLTLRSMQGKGFLLCTSRRGWREPLINNIIPTLPPHISPTWKRNRRDLPSALKVVWPISRLRRPAIVLFHGGRFEVVPLNGSLK